MKTDSITTWEITVRAISPYGHGTPLFHALGYNQHGLDKLVEELRDRTHHQN